MWPGLGLLPLPGLASQVPGEGAPGGCQGGVCARATLRGREPGPGDSGPCGGQDGDGARAGCGGGAATVPGSCLIMPFSIWALRVLGGDSECFLFLEGCVGSLGDTGTGHGASSPAGSAQPARPEDPSCGVPWPPLHHTLVPGVQDTGLCILSPQPRARHMAHPSLGGSA